MKLGRKSCIFIAFEFQADWSFSLAEHMSLRVIEKLDQLNKNFRARQKFASTTSWRQ
jgi:hypothetical protein